MKKFLLSLALVLGMGSVASAADVTLPENGTDWSAYTWTQSGDDFTATIQGYQFTLRKGDSQNALVSPDKYSIRVYQGAELSITAPSGTTFKTVTVTLDKNSKATSASASTGWTASAIASSKVTFTSETAQSTITFKGDKQMRVATVTFSNEAGGGDTPVDPGTSIANTAETAYTVTKALEILAAGKDLQTEVYIKGTVKSVTEVSTQYGNATYVITDGTSDLTVFRGYYLEGAKFTSADQLTAGMEVILLGKLTTYKDAPQVNTGSKLIKAEGGTPIETVEVADIAEFMELAAGAKARITSPVQAVWQHGTSLYIRDASGSTLVYGKLNETYTNGMTIAAGIEGTVSEFNGLKQMVPAADTFKAGVAGAAIDPEIIQIEEVSADIAYAYVEFKGVTIAAVEGDTRNFTMTDASGSVTLHQQWTDIEIPTGDNLTVTGFIGLYKGNAQVLAAKVTSASGREVVAAPTFNPAAGAVLSGTKVTIATTTEGATIYYTLDGTQPTAASAVYSEPIEITAATTVKALAVKDGMDDSEVATADYTIKEVGPIVGNTATFNFSDPSTLDPAYSKTDAVADGTTGNLKIDLANGDIFTANGIVLNANASGNAARLYVQKPDTENEAWSFRFYKNTVLTVSCQEAYKLVSISFEPQTNTYATALGKCTFSAGAFADNVLTFDTAAGHEVKSVTITNPASGGATIGLKTMTVTFSTVNAITDVEIDENAPVEYYNLQGVRINGELTPGLYIRRQGNAATKVIVK